MLPLMTFSHLTSACIPRSLGDQKTLHEVIPTLTSLLEKTSGPIGSETSFPDNLGLPQLGTSALIDDPEQHDDRAFITIEDG